MQYIYTNCGRDVHGPLPDDQLVKTTRGPVRADAITGGSSASLVVAGSDGNGDVTYTARGGEWGNTITVEHLVGATGLGNEDRELNASVVGSAITIIFGTDSAGESIAPTAADFVAAVSSTVAALVTIEAGGDGLSSVGLQALTNLSGGSNDGADYLSLGPRGQFTVLVNSRETI